MARPAAEFLRRLRNGPALLERNSTTNAAGMPAAEFAGREFDAALLRDLPEGADPCAERDEFHSCAYAGPMFGAPLRLEVGEVVHRGGFVFADFEVERKAQPV